MLEMKVKYELFSIVNLGRKLCIEYPFFCTGMCVCVKYVNIGDGISVVSNRYLIFMLQPISDIISTTPRNRFPIF